MRARITKLFLVMLMVFSLSGCALLGIAGPAEKKTAYIFSYFKQNGQDGLHLAWSRDGLKWESLNEDKPYLSPKLGTEKLMRDPCIIEGPDGMFHMVWTVSWWDKGIGVAHSNDLINWTEQQFVPVMEHEETAKNCWAPEIYYDRAEKEYIIYWATTIPDRFPKPDPKDDNNHRMYCTTTKDFKTWSDTKIFYEPGINVIDATIHKDPESGAYVMFIKDERRNPAQKNICTAWASKALGPYGPMSEPITGAYWAEGPTAIQIGEYWYVYFDKYTDHRYGAVRSKDLTNWEDVSDQIEFPKDTRHGTVLGVTESVLRALLEKDGVAVE